MPRVILTMLKTIQQPYESRRMFSGVKSELKIDTVLYLVGEFLEKLL